MITSFNKFAIQLDTSIDIGKTYVFANCMIKEFNSNMFMNKILIEIILNEYSLIEEIKSQEQENSLNFKNSQEVLLFKENHSIDELEKNFIFEGKLSRLVMDIPKNYIYESCINANC